MESDTFVSKDLSNRDFDNSDLSNADFINSDLRGSSFRGSTLTNANFDGADIRGCDFSMADLTGASFENAKIGVYARRFADLLFNAIGISAFFAGTAIASGDSTDLGITTDTISPSYSVSLGLFSSLVSLCAAALFLFSTVKTLRITEDGQVVGSSLLAVSFFLVFVFSVRHTISLLTKLSSTSFAGSNLDPTTFDKAS